MSCLQVIFDEIYKNEALGTTPAGLNPLIISHEMVESILDSFDYDPDTDTYLSQLSEVLVIHRHEQQHLMELLDSFLFQYMGQIKQDKDHSTSPVSTSSPLAPAMIGMPPSGCGYPLPAFPQLKGSMMLSSPPKKRQNFSREITNVLSQWLFTHCDHPYPSEHEKSVLCSLTGLSLSQVSGWFINARRRKLKKLNESTGSLSSGSSTELPCEHVVGKNEIALGMVDGDSMHDFDM